MHDRPPPAHGLFDYQIGGAYTPTPSVAIVDRDKDDAPVRGKYNICYVNTFQTQPSDATFWRTRHPNLLLRDARGRVVVDPRYPDEMLLDVSSPAKRAALATIVQQWFGQCARKGFQAVEADNLDSWSRSGGRLTQAMNVAFARLFVADAHRRGLAVAQKNGAEMARLGRASVHFDFAVAEECQVYRECQAYTAAYGTEVIEIEYTDNGRAAFGQACRSQGRRISVILRDRGVLPRGTRGYLYRHC